MKSIKLTLTAVLISVFCINFSQSNNGKFSQNVGFTIEGISEKDTISISTLENMKELKISDVFTNTKIIADFKLMKYDAVFVPKDKEAEYFIVNSNVISEQFLTNLKKNNGIVKVIFGEIKIQNNVNGEIYQTNPYVFFVKL